MTWSGWVTIYPILISKVQSHQAAISIILPYLLLWLQNFLFFTVVAIIFDIKDYRTDFYHHLKTYPVILGIRKTFRLIIIPGIFLNLFVFFLFSASGKVFFNTNYTSANSTFAFDSVLVKHKQQKKTFILSCGC
ncbi:MAG: hypothetical protein WKG06_41965 [Segetibacter sp.]